MRSRLNSILYLMVSCVLAGCSSAETPPVEVVTVSIPVAVTCLEDLPPRPRFRLAKPDAQNQVMLTKQALHDVLIARGYAGELEAVALGCN